MARAKAPILILALMLATAPAVRAQDAAPDSKTARPTLASKRARTSFAPVSQSWWLGTAFMILVLGVAGAVCIAAKHQGAGNSPVKLQVVGRVALPPKHAVFAVKAGGRTLLIGTGPQGAPSLLGELEDDEPDATTSTLARVDAAAPLASRRPIPAPGRFDVRIGDES
ncbi:flagellar biosynthetic protein FliO [Paludisphaera mucosa]|uniref:Flagellar biosynthetic protein FliO n=1 Tax=Paludisphaera mucosa TaxID=3030827 RepID=A0ABT6F4M9_9BACT|nr:flagellar biosynthetic protein FliO [Paludisphaera mucosa]MDG3002514.1 flagellar biosynthetic protein FliO [Paludisphaera mucosa]